MGLNPGHTVARFAVRSPRPPNHTGSCRDSGSVDRDFVCVARVFESVHRDFVLACRVGFASCHDRIFAIGVMKGDIEDSESADHDFHGRRGLGIFTCETPGSAFETRISAFCNENEFISERTTRFNACTGNLDPPRPGLFTICRYDFCTVPKHGNILQVVQVFAFLLEILSLTVYHFY